MNGDLKRLVRAAEGEPPSAEFRARLRAQIVAETEVADVESDDVAVVLDFEPTDDDVDITRRRPRAGLLLAAAAVLAVVGIWLATVGDEESGTDVTTEVDEEDVVAAQPITGGNTAFDAGVFRIDTLGTAFTFAIEQQTGLLVNGDGTVSIAAMTSRNADDRTITFRRTNLLPDPAAPTMRVDPATAWPSSDLRGWLDRVGDAVDAGEPVDTTLGDFRATFVELRFPCDGGPCRSGDLMGDLGLPVFTAGSSYRVWVVDQGEEDPILVTVAVEDGADSAWFDEADNILASLSFGPIEPNPVRPDRAGSVEIDAFGGLSVELPDEATVVEPHQGFARLIPSGLTGDVELLTRPLDVDGIEVTSTERLIEILEREAALITELPSTSIGGEQARIFSVDSGPFARVVLKTREADLARDEFGWASPRLGHLWTIEHPVRGLLILSTEATTQEQADAVFAWTRDLASSLEFEGS
ncbi:MAG: hypothetical protein AAF480_05755 [Actinomycetota bacterium]